MTRQIVLDTETTGLDPNQGHRIIEIGCVEIIDRKITYNQFHTYINPEREIDKGAFAVHGISEHFLADKPVFADISEQFVDFIANDDIIIHNAPFDLGFIAAELAKLKKSYRSIADYCKIVDTLILARKLHPGQRNNLDALCKRYHIDNSGRDLHGALLDARLLAELYLVMTSGQSQLFGANTEKKQVNKQLSDNTLSTQQGPLPVLFATADDLQNHDKVLEKIKRDNGEIAMWLEAGEKQ